MHEHIFLNRLQALDFTEVGIASYTSDTSSQAGNQRLDSTPSFTIAQHSVVTISRAVGWSGGWLVMSYTHIWSYDY